MQGRSWPQRVSFVTPPVTEPVMKIRIPARVVREVSEAKEAAPSFTSITSIAHYHRTTKDRFFVAVSVVLPRSRAAWASLAEDVARNANWIFKGGQSWAAFFFAGRYEDTLPSGAYGTTSPEELTRSGTGYAENASSRLREEQARSVQPGGIG